MLSLIGFPEVIMSFDAVIETGSRNERFMATIYATNTLLIQKVIYTQDEFAHLFVEWMKKEKCRKTTQ